MPSSTQSNSFHGRKFTFGPQISPKCCESSKISAPPLKTPSFSPKSNDSSPSPPNCLNFIQNESRFKNLHRFHPATKSLRSTVLDKQASSHCREARVTGVQFSTEVSPFKFRNIAPESGGNYAALKKESAPFIDATLTTGSLKSINQVKSANSGKETYFDAANEKNILKSMWKDSLNPSHLFVPTLNPIHEE
eukprot:Sdes_comp22169_c0_seq1m20681